MMRADYDSQANAISITLLRDVGAGRADEVHPRAIVALSGNRPVELQILYPDLGIDEPVRAAVRAYSLDEEALVAAIQAALAAPDRLVTVDVAVRSPA
jgi:hypothetical protein